MGNSKKNKKNKKKLKSSSKKKNKFSEISNVNYKSKKQLLLQGNNTKESLRDVMKKQLKGSQFRYLNEQMYTSKGKDTKKLFEKDPQLFVAYHEGYRQQTERWPINPLDVIIESIDNMTMLRNLVIADFGCGDARLAHTLQSKVRKVHSFDLVSSCPEVIACDMAHCPLPSESVDVAVYCLSLMGTNLNEYLLEANRVLKLDATLKIAEVESRFTNVNNFINDLKKFGFSLIWENLSNDMFYFLNFKKDRFINNKKNLPAIKLQPCLYKKR